MSLLVSFPGASLPCVLLPLQLILDLDETLVHSSFKPVAGADFIMDIMVDGTFYKVRTRDRSLPSRWGLLES